MVSLFDSDCIKSQYTSIFGTVRTRELEKFMRLMVWINGKTEDTWQSYGWKVVAFGDQPSSCFLEIPKKLTALAGEDIDKVAARSISQDTYVDDGATGGDEETAERLIGEVLTKDDGLLAYSGTLSRIYKKGNDFEIKFQREEVETLVNIQTESKFKLQLKDSQRKLKINRI